MKYLFQDFLRQRNLPEWQNKDPRYAQLIALRPKTADDVAKWVCAQKDGLDGQDGHNGHHQSSMQSIRSIPSISFPEIAANAALILITVAMSLLNRQLEAQGNTFMKEGGFTERLFRLRSKNR